MHKFISNHLSSTTRCYIQSIASGQIILTKACIAGGFWKGANLMWHSSVSNG